MLLNTSGFRHCKGLPSDLDDLEKLVEAVDLLLQHSGQRVEASFLVRLDRQNSHTTYTLHLVAVGLPVVVVAVAVVGVAAAVVLVVVINYYY